MSRALLVLDMVSQATRDAYDIAILVAGDEDYVPAVLEVRMLGKVVENAFVDYRGWGGRLWDVSDSRIKLDEEFLEGCWP